MSRIGRLPIAVPSGVDVTIAGRELTVKGPKGTLPDAAPGHAGQPGGRHDVVARPTEQKTHKQLHGLTRTLVNNMVIGVTDGYRKGLEITGVGYRAALNGRKLTLNLGYSHPVEIDPPEGISFEVENPTRLAVIGIDKELVGQIAACARRASPSRTRARACATPGIRSPQGRQGRQDRRQEVVDEGLTSNDASRQPRRRPTQAPRPDPLTMAGTAGRPRLTIFRSLNHIYAQVIDDASGRTLVAASTPEKDLRGGRSTKTEEAAVIGRLIAERSKAPASSASSSTSRVPVPRADLSLADAARKPASTSIEDHLGTASIPTSSRSRSASSRSTGSRRSSRAAGVQLQRGRRRR